MKPSFTLLAAFVGSLFATAVPARAQFYPGNTALSFNGTNQYVRVNQPFIPTSGEFTIECWVNATSTTGAFREIVSQGLVASAPRFYLGIDPAGNIRVGDAWSAPGVALGSGWVHIAVTRTASNAFLYLDGVLMAEKGSPLASPGTAPWADIGQQFENGAEFWKGQIDEFRVWDRARTQAEIRSTMGHLVGGSEANLVFNLRLDNGSGTVATNGATATGATYNGTLTNGPAWTSPGAPVSVEPVASTADSGSGSLRVAIASSLSGATIGFSPDLSGETITLSSQLVIGKNLSIDASALTAGVTISGNDQTRILVVNPGVTASLTALTIRDGKAPNGTDGPDGEDNVYAEPYVPPTRGHPGGKGDDGGAIHNAGTLTLTDCALISNAAGNGGRGGNGGNSAPPRIDLAAGGDGGVGGAGGGIYNGSTGVLELVSCTLDGNTAGRGGNGGDSGFSDVGRTSGGAGGGGGAGGAIRNQGTMTLTACTVAANTAGSGGSPGYAPFLSAGSGGSGGGISNDGTATLRSSLIARNSVPAGGAGPDVAGAITSQGDNLVRVTDGSSGWDALIGDLLGNAAAPLDPQLAPLGDFGGRTPTRLPLAGSPLIDAVSGGAPLPATDQRGFPRVLDGDHDDLATADIGAVEILTGADLSGLDFSGARLNNNDLTGSDLSSSILAGTDLTGVTLSGVRSGGITGTAVALPDGWLLTGGYLVGPGADLGDADLGGVDLTGADLSGASLTGVSSGWIIGSPAVLPGEWLLVGGYLVGPGADLRAANLAGLDLTGANFTGADLSGADLSGAILTGATLSGAVLADADLDGVILTGVRSGGITGSPAVLPAGSLLAGGYLAGPGVDLGGVDLGGFELSGTDLAGANLSTAILAGAVLTGTKLADADLADADLTGANLAAADLTGAILTGVRSGAITGTPIALPSGWQLIGGYLVGPGADLSDADLGGLDLGGADFTGANLSGIRSGGITGSPAALPAGWVLASGYLIGPGADLGGADFSGADLSGLNFTGTVLGGADFSGAYAVVDTTTDEVDLPASGGTGISLREALRDAPGGIEIRFDAALNGGTITLDGTHLLIDKDLTIGGSGLAAGISVSGDNRSRVFVIDAGATVSLIALNIRDGLAPTGTTGSNSPDGILALPGGPGGPGGHGGGIHNSGTLQLTACTVAGNRAGRGGTGGQGGNVYEPSGPFGGGGGYLGTAPGGQGGSGGSGGGIYNSGVLEMFNCTLSGNGSGAGGSAGPAGTLGTPPTAGVDGTGGGLRNLGTMTLTSCTVSGNTSANGGGISTGGTTNLGNTLIARNIATVASPDVSGVVVSTGYNLIGNDEGSTLTGDPTGTLTGSNETPLDPILGPLADNGGPTLTIALLQGSPAQEAGDPALAGSDQRGFPRPSRGQVDIGAYEALPFPADIIVEQPAGTVLVDGFAAVDFGYTVTGTGTERPVTIRNSGDVDEDLTGISVTIDGANAGDFTFAPPPPASLAPGASASFTVSFTPSAHGAAAAALHIASDDPDENPFDISLTAYGYRPGDTDGDGLTNLDELTIHGTDPDLADSDEDGANDGAEVNLASLGFVNGADNSALVALLRGNSSGLGMPDPGELAAAIAEGESKVTGDPNAFGLYTLDQVHALHAPNPLIARDPASGKFTLTMDWKKSTDLSNFADFPAGAAGVSVNPQGDIQFEFDAPNDAAFFKVDVE